MTIFLKNHFRQGENKFGKNKLYMLTTFQSCITSNRIDGRKLITLEASQLPNIGITDFKHIKVKWAASKTVRKIERYEIILNHFANINKGNVV